MDSTTKGLRTTGTELSPLRSTLALKPTLTLRVARARARGGAGRFHDPPKEACGGSSLGGFTDLGPSSPLPIQLALLSQGSHIRGPSSSHGKDKGV